MKTTLVALNEKLAVTNDIKQDADDHNEYLGNSEAQRQNLQQQMEQTAQKILQDAAANAEQHKKLEDAIADLMAQL